MNKKNLRIRCISAFIIGAIFITAIFVFRPLFYVLLYTIATFMLIEWYNMTKNSTTCHKILGQVLIPLPIASILFMSYLDSTGWLLLIYFTIIWSVDSMALFGGKLIGGRKLAPNLSPNKTISGLFTGVTSAIIITNILTYISNYQAPDIFINSCVSPSIFAFVIGITAQISDLLISFFKRKFNLKDTGTIIPGHGGMLDRFDSIILTAPLVIMILLVIPTCLI